MKIQTIIADDHEIFRDGLRSLLYPENDIETVGEAGTVTEVCMMAGQLKPDVILMDIRMPDGSGIDATSQILESHPEIRILMLTMYEDDPTVFAAMRVGARGYLLKGAKHADILQAIRFVYAGGAVFSPNIAERMANFFTQIHAIPNEITFPELSQRAHEVLTLLAHEHSNPQIADKLFISDKTVRNHVSNILRKLGVANRMEAARIAQEAGVAPL